MKAETLYWQNEQCSPTFYCSKTNAIQMLFAVGVYTTTIVGHYSKHIGTITDILTNEFSKDRFITNGSAICADLDANTSL